MTSVTLEREWSSYGRRLSYYYLYEFWEEHGDERSASFPLMGSGPLPILALCLTYVLFVKVVGPLMMRGRKPFDLRELMVLHNCLLIGVNGCGCLIGLWITDGMQTSWSCGPETNDPLKRLLAVYLGYILLLSKFVDLLDTIFFVLRKKYNQVTFLHVFHHGLMPCVVWLGLKVHPSGMSSALPIINAFVHFVMYSYYSLSCAGFKNYLWWKKHITQIQLLQFVSLLVHGLYSLSVPDCQWPKILATLEVFYASLFFYMFYAFYRRAYGSSAAAAAAGVAEQIGGPGVGLDSAAKLSSNGKVD